MDCHGIKDLLDAYALGAAEKREAEGIERHASDCVRCWEQLNEAQQAAALLALSVPLERAPAALRERIMAQAAREAAKAPAAAVPARRRRFTWTSAAGALGAAGVAALVFSAFLQVQMSDLRGEKNDLSAQVADLRIENSDLGARLAAAGSAIGRQHQVLTVMSSSDVQTVSMAKMSAPSGAAATYGWSPANSEGFILCEGLPPLEDGEVYQAWFIFGNDPVAADTFSAPDGACIVPLDLTGVRRRPSAIGITIEPDSGSTEPSGGWLLYASFEQ